MAPLKRKRPHDAAPARPAPEAPPGPGPGPGPGPKAMNSTPSVTRRTTRQTSTVAPQPPPWAADPEPRRRRRTSAHGTHVSDKARAENHGHDHDENHDDGVSPVLERRMQKKKKAHTRPVEPPAPDPAAPPASAPPKSAAPGRGRGRGRERGREGSRSGSSAQQPRPVLRATNQADPAVRPRPVIRNRALRHQQHDVDGAVRPDALIDRDTNRPVAPMQMHAEADPAPLRRRGSAVGPPVAGGAQPPTKTTQKHHPPLSTTKTVPIMTQAQPLSVRTSDHIAANTSKHFVPATTIPTQSPPKPPKKQLLAKQNPDQKKSNTIDRNIDKVVFGNVCFSTWYHSPYGTEALGEISSNGVKANGVSGVHEGGSKEEALSNPTNRKTKEDKLDRLYVCPCCFKYSKELVPWWQHVHLCERRGYVPGEKIYTHPKGRRTRQPQASAAASTASKGPGRKKRNVDGTSLVVEEEVEDQGEWSIWQVDGEEEGLFCQNLSLFAKLFLDNKSVFFDVVGFNYFLLVHTAPRPPPDGDGEPLPPKHQIVGFFSKEKLSWDNNNLACILVFPPWQRKGLGALLMGVSYEISRREGMLGGPEKPISDLGKKGYKRFWAGEIAAWVLDLDTSGEDEVVVDVDECSEATWILPEDCLMVLREMGVVEEAEAGPPKRRRCVDVSAPEDGEGTGESVVSGKKEEEVKDVPRVRITKEAVWAWVQANNISLEKACDPNGFVEGYAIKEIGVEEEEL